MTTVDRPVTEVAAGILLDATGRYLLGQRPEGKPYAGYWEVPGGKIEAGESVFDALKRELQEELGIDIQESEELLVLEHDYPHAYVRLHVSIIRQWQG
ncbi:MAG TPA: NUDIX domain-containing protein, partial [Polynucleobacter sp.]|nr:NUDIX domain-containing protein [Polynucleobacter sp.]